jgi:hypothetical protein
MIFRLVSVLICLTLASAWCAKIPSTRRLDSAWKRYANDDLGYCVSYPSRWLRGEAFEGAGMYFETGTKKYGRPAGEMDISAFSDLKPVDYLETHLEGLKKFERAQNLKVLEKREMPLLGTVALFTKDTYFDPQDRTDWVDEIVLAKYHGVLYRLELECRADQVSRFEPLFAQFVQSFRIDCGSR